MRTSKFDVMTTVTVSDRDSLTAEVSMTQTVSLTGILMSTVVAHVMTQLSPLKTRDLFATLKTNMTLNVTVVVDVLKTLTTVWSLNVLLTKRDVMLELMTN